MMYKYFIWYFCAINYTVRSVNKIAMYYVRIIKGFVIHKQNSLQGLLIDIN